MPRSTLAQESIGRMSESEEFSQYSDEESIIADVESDNRLPLAEQSSLTDQSLLKQAFRGSVHGRKATAQDWRHDRESQFVEDPDSPVESDSKKVDKSQSYSSKIRGYLQKMTQSSKKSGRVSCMP
jgi:hypothetical protein